VDELTARKWDRAAASFDLMNGYGPDLRWSGVKRELFSEMKAGGKVLFLAVGTGLDIACFPAGCDIVGIDISPKMVERAKPRAAAYDGRMEVHLMDVHEMDFEDERFDQIFTACTFCSVPHPVHGLGELYRVLKPGGTLGMFEHTGSRYFPFMLMMHFMTLISRQLGPSMNRPTVANVQKAGFQITGVTHHYLDVVKSIRALKPAS
jgi:ubiquinone/menaquinone biosynthesis C-methylase UbiE